MTKDEGMTKPELPKTIFARSPLLFRHSFVIRH